MAGGAKPVEGVPARMTVLVDIDCPDCGRSRPVEKIALGRYGCDDCGIEFSQEDVLPE